MTNGSDISFKPLALLTEQLTTMYKTKYFMLLAGTLHVEIRINCGPYVYGSIIATTYPINHTDHLAGVANLYRIVTMDHVIAPVAHTRSLHMELPVSHQKAYINLCELDDNDYIVTRINVLSALRNSTTGASDSIHYNVYAHIVNAKVDVPTPYGIVAAYPVSEEQEVESSDGYLSRPLTFIQGLGYKLRNIPLIGKYAYATSLISGGMARAAMLFGFSRPRYDKIADGIRDDNMSTSIGPLRAKTHTTDAMSQIPLTQEDIGINADNLTFANTLCRKGVILQVDWTLLQDPFTTFWMIPVGPSYVHTANDYISVTPLTYFSTLYRYWRGSIKYTVHIPGNRFLSGKLRVFWCPYQKYDSAYNTAHYADTIQNAYSAVFDISTGVEFSVTIPYGQEEPWRIVGVPTNTPPADWHNGCLCIMVEERLIAPTTGVSINIVVFEEPGCLS